MAPRVTSVKFTRKVAGDPKFNQNEWVVEVANDQDNPVAGAELMRLAVEAAASPPKIAPAAQAKPVKQKEAPASSVVAVKPSRYNLEAVPIGKRSAAVKILEEANAKYNEAEDLWYSETALPKLAKFLVE